MSKDAEMLLNHLNSMNLRGGDFVIIGDLVFLFNGSIDRTQAAMGELSMLRLAIGTPTRNAIALPFSGKNSN